MSVTSEVHPNQLQTTASGPAWLRQGVEQLFLATDSATVMSICEHLLGKMGIHGQLHWSDVNADSHASQATQLRLADDAGDDRTLMFECAGAAMSAQALDELQWVGRLAGIRMRQLAENSRLYEAISHLALAERLQRALYAIAEQAGADQPMPAMMRALHSIVSSLMYAENFYIVLYDPVTQNVRFPYYVDIVDTDLPLPDQDIPLQSMQHSLTWTLLQKGQPMLGSEAELKQQFGAGLMPVGSACEH